MDRPVIELNGYCTIKTLADLEGVSSNYIRNLLRLEKISGIQYPELNDMTLLRLDTIKEYRENSEQLKQKKKNRQI